MVTGGGGRQASTEGQGTGMGRRGHNRVGKSPGRAGPSPHPSLLPAVSKGGGRAGWGEGLAVNASGRCWSLGLRVSQSQLRAQGHGALKAWVRQRGGIQPQTPELPLSCHHSTGGGRRGSLFRTGQLTRVSGTQDGLDGVLPPCRSWHRSCPAQVLAAST